MSLLENVNICSILDLERDLTQKSLDDFIAAIRDRYGLSHSLYFSASLRKAGTSEPFVLTSYDEAWVAHYQKERYVSIDPTYQIGARSIAPIDWCRLSTRNKKVSRLFDEARDAGVGRQGLTIPVRGLASDDWGLLTVTSDDNDAAWSRRRHHLVRDIIHVAHYVHQHAADLHGKCDTVDLDAITKREIEALAFAADGKSLAETAALMRISAETVKSHLDSVRHKLEALNKVHAVSKAIRYRLIR